VRPRRTMPRCARWAGRRAPGPAALPREGVITATREPAREARDGADGDPERAEPIQREVVTFPAEVVTFPAEVVTTLPKW